MFGRPQSNRNSRSRSKSSVLHSYPSLDHRQLIKQAHVLSPTTKKPTSLSGVGVVRLDFFLERRALRLWSSYFSLVPPTIG